VNVATNGVTYTATVAAMPTVTNTAESRVLTPAPWEAETSVAALDARFGNVLATCGTDAPARLAAVGSPNAKAITDAVALHEASHAALIEAVYYDTIQRWDERLQAAYDAQAQFTGPTAAAATQALESAMGGSHAQIFEQYEQDRDAVMAIFHASDRGLPLQVTKLVFGTATGINQGTPGTSSGGNDCRLITAQVSEDPKTVALLEQERQAEKARRKQEKAGK
jgi:hypothetical protein